MEQITFFEVMGHTDTVEGRRPMKVVARFSNYFEAEKYVDSKQYSEYCVMGHQSREDYQNIKEVTIIILDTVTQLDLLKTEELKSKALSKLSIEERKLLGV